jgi:hypothetical protein
MDAADFFSYHTKQSSVKTCRTCPVNFADDRSATAKTLRNACKKVAAALSRTSR